MAYTASANKAGNTVQANQGNAPATSRSNFGAFRVDANRVAMTGSTANYMQSEDATPTTPNQSPLTVNTTATLVVPLNAVAVTIISTTNAVQVSEDSTMTAYFTLPAATLFTFQCANQANVYLKTGSSTVVNFQFQTV